MRNMAGRGPRRTPANYYRFLGRGGFGYRVEAPPYSDQPCGTTRLTRKKRLTPPWAKRFGPSTPPSPTSRQSRAVSDPATAPKIETELAALVRACLADLSTAGILSDFLEDRGDARGVLLRRRWKRWQREREECEECEATDIYLRANGLSTETTTGLGWKGFLVHPSHVERESHTFRMYVRRRFRDAFA